MKKNHQSILRKLLIIQFVFLLTTVSFSCSDDDSTSDGVSTDDGGVTVDESLFLTDGGSIAVTIVACTLSDGTVGDCYQIVTSSNPIDHEMGPWCPETITDGVEAGGIWLENGQVYDVDGAFIENLAEFYDDTSWQMYDLDGNIIKTETETDCANAANPNVGEEYENFCVECLPSFVTDISNTYLIPVVPSLQTSAIQFGGGGPGGGNTAPSIRGLAFNGVVFDAPAPVDAILGAYTIAPFDDAGGHINLAAGYHYHAATGNSTEIAQEDGHAAQIGYAIDGHGIYKHLNEDDIMATDLDECRGHTDEARGYHYHVAAAGSNSFIDCLKGAYAL